VKLTSCALGHLLLAALLMSVSAPAQQAPKGDDPSAAHPTDQTQQGTPPNAPAGSIPPQESNKDLEKQEQSERVLGIVPHFGTTDRQDAPPLTPGGKFHLFARSAFDPFTIAVAAAQAGVSQADNQFADYGQGASGYGKRFGAAFADEVSSNFFSNFLYPTMLKHDPRYFRLGTGGFKQRLFYSIKQQLVCHTDAGGRSFNYSAVVGAFSSGALSNVYYPASDRGFKLTMSRSGLALVYGTAGGLLNEFWPDISRELFPKHKKENAAMPETSAEGTNPK
jgi:hypothetical protein